MTGAAVAVATAIVVASVGAVVWAGFARRSRKKQLPERAPLSPRDIHRQYYSDDIPFEVVDRALRRLGELLDVDPRFVRPEDRFDAVLRPPKGWEFDDGLTILSEDLLRRHAETNIPIRIDDVQTVDDYIRAEFSVQRATRPA